MAEEKATKPTLVFVDISADTNTRVEPGTGQQGGDFLKRWLSRLSLVMSQHAGNTVHTIGNTLRCSFENTDDALRCCCGMQQQTNDRVSTLAGPTPALRIGLDHGEVSMRNDTYAGEVVMIAARMALLARPRQIIATGNVFEVASEEMRWRMDPLPQSSEIKVRLGDIETYEVAWQDEDAQADKPVELSAAVEEPISIPAPSSKEVRMAVPLKPAAKPAVKLRRKVVLRKAQSEVTPSPEQDTEPEEPGVQPVPSGDGTPPAQLPVSLPVFPSSGQRAQAIPIAPAVDAEQSPPESEPSSAPLPDRKVTISLRPALRQPLVLHPTSPSASPPADDDAEATQGVVMQLPSPRRSVGDVRLRLTVNGQDWIIDRNTNSLTLGRSPENDLPLNIDGASRLHARLDYRDGSFFYVDHSSNGTLVHDESEDYERLVHNDEIQLATGGVIGPGCSIDDLGSRALFYRIEEH